jgi:hypothetical protein
MVTQTFENVLNANVNLGDAIEAAIEEQVSRFSRLNKSFRRQMEHKKNSSARRELRRKDNRQQPEEE